jgi:adenosylmethionine-8-amino-7-oxononanoate aminotransferase
MTIAAHVSQQKVKQSYLLGNVMGEQMPTISHGSGVWLYDTEGKKYLDGSSGATAANIGHAVLEITEAIHAQAQRVSFVHRGHFTNEAAEALGELIAGLSPAFLQRLFLVSSGSEAVETACKLALQSWAERGQPHKNMLLSRHTSYHGSTFTALSLSGHPLRRRAWQSVLVDSPKIAEASCYRCEFGLTHPACGLHCADDVERAILETRGRAAAVVLEPVVGASGGAVSPPDGYFKKVAEICQKHDVLLIADEVMCGVWRAGTFLASSQENVSPDLVVLGKGLAAGYAPLAGVLVGERVVGALEQGSGIFLHGHTHSFNPVSASAGLAVLHYILKNDLATNIEARSQQLRAGLKRLAEEHPMIGDVRGRGLLLGIELVADRAERTPLAGGPLAPYQVAALAKEKGLLLYAAGTGVTSPLLVTPPFTISSAEVDVLLELLDDTLRAYARGVLPAHSH